MERDFLGLSSKEQLTVVKEEVNSDGFKEIGFSKGSGIHWPFPNKVSALPHLMSFKFAQEDKTKRTVYESLVSPGLLSLSTTDAFEPSQKPVIAETQKSFNHDRQVGTQFTLTAYPVQHDVHHPREMKMFPVSNYPSSISLSNPFLKNHYATTGQNIVGTTMKPQLQGGISVTNPQTILPTIGSVVGLTESCSANVSASPAQLTIFYAGTVNVYDDILPEKAQAIMFLAGNGSSISSNTTQAKIQVQDPNSKPVATDASPANNPVSTPPCSRLSSPISVSSHTGVQSGSGSISSEEIMAAKTTAAATTSVNKLDTPKLTSPLGSIAATTMIPSVPQARKASLARFLEKRKERVMSAAPYNLGKTSPESHVVT